MHTTNLSPDNDCFIFMITLDWKEVYNPRTIGWLAQTHVDTAN
jgi:hypothetical protein